MRGWTRWVEDAWRRLIIGNCKMIHFREEVDAAWWKGFSFGAWYGTGLGIVAIVASLVGLNYGR